MRAPREATPASGRMAVPVAAVMSTRAVQIPERASLRETQALAARYDYNSFPVVAPDGRLVGMLTKGDLLRAARAAALDSTVWNRPVSEWTTRTTAWLQAQDSVATAVELMLTSGLRSLPVIDQDDRVVAMVSRNDLILALSAEEELR